MPGFLTHLNCEVINVCCFKLLTFGVMCYTARDTVYIAQNLKQPKRLLTGEGINTLHISINVILFGNQKN